MSTKQRIVEGATVTVTIYRGEYYETPTGGKAWRRVEDHKEEVTYNADIVMPLDYLGSKAALNKSGKTSDGPLTVYVTSRRRL